jgi:hypothetical protein
MDSTHTASLDIPELSAAAAVAHVFPAMANNSLLSVVQLCNEGYSVTFTIDDITIFNKIGKEILKLNRDMDTWLWRINLRKEIQHNPTASANNVYGLGNNGALVDYLHKPMFSPTKAALIKAKLCNEGYSVTFTIDGITIFNKIGKEILKLNRDLDTWLWRINLRKEIQHNPTASANNVYELGNNGALVNYLHKPMFSPTKAALIKAVKQGHLATWPGLTEDAINNHLKLMPETAMGHMNQKCQNIRSTNKVVTITSDFKDTTVTPAVNGDKTIFFNAALIDQGQLYNDLTWRFPQRSSKGNWYIMVVY